MKPKKLTERQKGRKINRRLRGFKTQVMRELEDTVNSIMQVGKNES